MCLEEQPVTFTALTCTGWTWPPGSGSTWNPTTHPLIYLKKGPAEHKVLSATVSEVRWNILKNKFMVLQVQTWTCSWWTEDLHFRRRNFLDIIPPGQGGSTHYNGQENKSLIYYSYIVVFLPNQIHAYNLETNYWEEIVTKPHQKIGLLAQFWLKHL